MTWPWSIKNNIPSWAHTKTELNATHVSNDPGGIKTINVRLEWPWSIENNTSIPIGPGKGRTLKARLEWPWPVQTHVDANVGKSALWPTGARESEGGGPRQVNGQCAS